MRQSALIRLAPTVRKDFEERTEPRTETYILNMKQ